MHKYKATDWTKYYSKPKSRWSLMTQRITMRYITKYISKLDLRQGASFCECGGGDSGFADELIEKYRIGYYDIIDKDKLGVEKAQARHLPGKAYCLDLTKKLDDVMVEKYDFVFSLGLVEHFSDSDRFSVIDNHFKLAKNGGYVMITAPTPTLKYRFFRKMMEMIGVWQFWDERPISLESMISQVNSYGEIIHAGINSELPLTQLVVIVKK